jgi:hypothetical protein
MREAHDALVASNAQLRREADAHEQTLRLSRRSFDEVRALYEKEKAKAAPKASRRATPGGGVGSGSQRGSGSGGAASTAP